MWHNGTMFTDKKKCEYSLYQLFNFSAYLKNFNKTFEENAKNTNKNKWLLAKPAAWYLLLPCSPLTATALQSGLRFKVERHSHPSHTLQIWSS